MSTPPKDLAVEAEKYTNLPTGKPHVSFSEVKGWKECSYRHKLQNIDKIDLGKPSPILAFGTAMHAACESFLNTGVMDPQVAINDLNKAFTLHALEEKFTPKELALMTQQALDILPEVPPFLDTNFPGWRSVEAEHVIYEPVTPEKREHAFKGYIDAVLEVPNPKNSAKPLTYIIDWKTTNSYWSADKKSDPMVTGQLVSYKNYWMQEHNIPPADIRLIKCGFILLKRTGKPGNRLEYVPVSVGDVTIGKTLKVINNCVTSIKRGVAIKNRDACRWCDYRGTPHCT